MIEGPQRGSSSPSGPGRRGFSAARVVTQAQAQLGMLWQRLVPAGGGRVPADLFLWRLRLVDRIFWVILAVLGVYVVTDLLVPLRRLPVIVQTVPSGAIPAAGPEEADRTPAGVLEQQLRPVVEYREVLASKDPFGLGSGRAGGAAGSTAQGRLEELTAKLAVVGVNRSRTPEVLIEDLEAKRTHFLKVGDQINGMTVTAIDERGVTLSYEGEETTLQ